MTDKGEGAANYSTSKVERPDCEELWIMNKKHFVEDSVVLPEQPQKFYEVQNAIVLPADSSRGNVLILNILQYYGANYKNRNGAIADTHNMAKLCRELGYKYVKPIDEDDAVCKQKETPVFFTEDEVSKILKDFAKECIDKEAKSIVVFIGAHGLNEEIIMPDGTTGMNIRKDIVGEMAECAKKAGKSEYWAKTPKIFIIQACRDAPKDGPTGIGPNTLVCYSTSPGVGSYRTEYVQGLTKVIMKNAHQMDLVTMLKQTQFKVLDTIIKKKRGDTQQPTYDDPIGEFKLYFELKPKAANTLPAAKSTELNKRLVGDEGCETATIIGILKESPVIAQLDNNLFSIAISLGTPIIKKNQLRKNIRSDEWTSMDCLENLLEEWRLRCPRDATLVSFIEMLKKDKLNDFAQRLSRLL